MAQSLEQFEWVLSAVGELDRVPERLRGLLRAGVPVTIRPGVGTCVHTDLIDAGVIPDPTVGMNEVEVEWVSWTSWEYATRFAADPWAIDDPHARVGFERLDTIATVRLNDRVLGEASSEFVPWRFAAAGVLRQGVNELRVRLESPLARVHELAKEHGRPHNGDEQGWHPYNLMRKAACDFGWDWGPRLATCGLASPSVRWGKPTARGPARTMPRRASFRVPAYELVVDGRMTFAKGANWIPEGLWPRDRTPERIRARLEQAKAAGMNMIRVWGGGRYESEAFYDACDELGLWVWQDFMFACGAYPEEEPWWSLIEAEARHQVARLAEHPCVVVWCGGNENHWAMQSWGFAERLRPGRTWGHRLYHDLLPRIVGELSPHTPYVPDSPWSEPPGHPNLGERGDRHTWDRFGVEFTSHVPRFCSEFGVQSPSTRRTLEETGLTPSSPDGPIPAALIARQRGPGGMARWYDEMFAKGGVPAPTGFEDWLAKAHQLQADWLFLAVVWLRLNQDVCKGALIWQLNDAWPGLSWSLIDSKGREKPSYHAVARAFADRVRCSLPTAEGTVEAAINDTDEPWEAIPGWVIPPRSTARRPL